MHSIHVDHGIHTISSRLMAAMHIFLRPPLPLLSLSPGYFPRTKGSGLPTPQFFFFLSITYDRYVPTPGPMSNIGLMIYAIFVRMDSREPYAIRRGVKDTGVLLMHAQLDFISSSPSCWLTRDARLLILGGLREQLLSYQPFGTPICQVSTSLKPCHQRSIRV
jgi:hypothetical protein